MNYIEIGFNSINLIEELWEKNRIYHEDSSEFFSTDYRSICFEERMSKFSDFKEDLFKITICEEKDKIIGYCISTIANSVGELESIHVAEAKRRLGIGERLVDEHLQWMKKMNCKSIGDTVSQENKTTINFYKKFGFYPNTLYMQQLS